MPKFEIEIDAPIPDGWEPVAFRYPREGEHYCNGYDCKVMTQNLPYTNNYHLIVQKKWAPLPWYPDGWWLYPSLNGSWFISPLEPEPVGVCLWGVSGEKNRIRVSNHPDFVEPPERMPYKIGVDT